MSRRLDSLRLRLRALFRRARVENEMNDELAFHLEREIEKRLAAGMSREEARLAALRSFGGVEQVREEVRAARGASCARIPALPRSPSSPWHWASALPPPCSAW
jgi:hypothetical protein